MALVNASGVHIEFAHMQCRDVYVAAGECFVHCRSILVESYAINSCLPRCDVFAIQHLPQIDGVPTRITSTVLNRDYN